MTPPPGARCYLFGHESIQLTTMGLASVLLNLLIATTERVFVRWVMKKEVATRGARPRRRSRKRGTDPLTNLV